MKKKPHQIVFCGLIFLIIAFSARAETLTGQTVSLCEDEAEWPPYHYMKREDGKPTKEAIGYGIDVLNEIFGKHDIRYTIRFLPWKRCLEAVKDGEGYHMILSGSYNIERDNAYYLVNWYKTSVYYFYSKKQYPNGLEVSQLSDFGKYRRCGLFEYNYSYLGELEKEMDTGTKSYDALIPKLHLGRCAVFFQQYEILAGFVATGKNYLSDKDLSYAKAPELEPTWFNMLISKKYKHSLELKKILSEGIAELFWSGKFKTLLKKHGLIAE